MLGIETSCDETGIAVVRVHDRDVPTLVAQELHSQIDMHAEYGGVVPELASRDHIRRVLPLLRATLTRGRLSASDIDLVAYTRGPGLAGALLVGAGVACALAAALQRPAVGIHHLEGHLLSPFLSVDPPTFPFLALLVSGGHTQLLKVTDVGRYELLGDTIDDAAGEAFDKSAQLLGLGYPGGPALARLAELGNPSSHSLPRPLLNRANLDFSFAGLKTAVRIQASRIDATSEQARADLAASTQEAIVDVLARKSVAALEATGLDHLVVAGGVGANAALRQRLVRECEARGARVHFPEMSLCTDNGAMIALAAGMRWQRGIAAPTEGHAFDVRPRWALMDA